MSDALSEDTRAWRLALWFVAALTIVRLAVLFITPLELYPDEAQYWLWSRTIDFGYFSKPPMIAWLIAATTSLGNAEPFVRLAAPLLHAGTALALFGVGQRLYGAKAGLIACLVYSLMPGVQLSSGVISTDAPLLFFLSLGLLAYVSLQTQRALGPAIALGVALGLAMLSKYAAIYALAGIALHLIASKEARQAWSLKSAGAAILAFGLVLAPNLAWNARNGFATVEHTAANANWASDLGGLPEMGEFLLSQLGVFGPLPFVVLIGGALVQVFRRKVTKEDLLLLAWTLPPLIVVAAQAFISRANANWAASAYVAGSVLAAALLVRWKAKWWLIGGLGLQAVVAALFLTWAAFPKTADAMGASNSFKRARGWEGAVTAMIDRARQEPYLTAVAVDDRFLFNAAAYYGRDYFGVEGPPLQMWLATGQAHNQAEADAPLTAATGDYVLAVSIKEDNRDRMAADFMRAQTVEIARIRLDPERVRRVEMMLGEGFSPAPR